MNKNKNSNVPELFTVLCGGDYITLLAKSQQSALSAAMELYPGKEDYRLVSPEPMWK
jgi:hypothetical protein